MKNPIKKYSKGWWIAYLIINVLMALGYIIFGAAAAAAVEIIVLVGGFILAIVLIFSGFAAFGTSGWVGAIICWVLAAVVFALLGSLGEWFFYVIIVAFCILLLAKYRKPFNPAKGTKKGTVITVTWTIYPIVICVALILSLITETGASQLNDVAVALCAVGSVCWLINTILTFSCAVSAWKRGEVCSPSSYSGGGYSGGSGKVSDGNDVAKAMKSVASSLDGGTEGIGHGSTIRYSTSVSVYGGNIEFTIKGRVHVGKISTESEAKAVSEAVNRAMQNRGQLTLNKANARFDGLSPDRDYEISVKSGGVEFDNI